MNLIALLPALLLLAQAPAEPVPAHRTAEPVGIYENRVVQAGGQVWPRPRHDGFLVFDALGDPAQPQHRWAPPTTLPRARLGYQHLFDYKGQWTPQEYLSSFFARPAAIYTYDFESDPVDVRIDEEAAVAGSIDRLRELVELGREAEPAARVGFYGLLPLRDYWVPVNYQKRVENYRAVHDTGGPEQVAAARAAFRKARANYLEWHAANVRLGQGTDRDPRGLPAAVDYVAPSLYFFYDDPASNAVYADHNLRMARLYGRPVYPFVWPRFHNAAKPEELAGQPIPLEAVLPAYRAIREQADGVVLWGHPIAGEPNKGWTRGDALHVAAWQILRDEPELSDAQIIERAEQHPMVRGR